LASTGGTGNTIVDPEIATLTVAISVRDRDREATLHWPPPRQDVRVLVGQTTAVDPQRLGDFAGRLDPDELMEINVALRAVLDLE
jgi:mRNA-degrading endonuclease toxin of MazEF toxin-antitoxin module